MRFITTVTSDRQKVDMWGWYPTKISSPLYAGKSRMPKHSIWFGTLGTESLNYRHHPHVSTFCLATWHCLMSSLMTRSHRPFPFIFTYCRACKRSKTGWWIGLRTRLQHGSQVNHQVGLDTYDELNVLWEMHMEAEGSLTVARPKGATHNALYDISTAWTCQRLEGEKIRT